MGAVGTLHVCQRWLPPATAFRGGGLGGCTARSAAGSCEGALQSYRSCLGCMPCCGTSTGCPRDGAGLPRRPAQPGSQTVVLGQAAAAAGRTLQLPLSRKRPRAGRVGLDCSLYLAGAQQEARLVPRAREGGCLQDGGCSGPLSLRRTLAMQYFIFQRLAGTSHLAAAGHRAKTCASLRLVAVLAGAGDASFRCSAMSELHCRQHSLRGGQKDRAVPQWRGRNTFQHALLFLNERFMSS